jgi:hypothetical protein
MPRQPANAQISQNGHDQREEWQLPADHCSQQEWVDAGHAREAGDRCAECAIGDRRRVGDQRQARGRERREAKPNQNRAGHRDRRAEARSAFEERTEAERDEKKLQAAVAGDAPDGGLERFEHAFLHREPVEEDDVEYDPADWEEPGDGAEHGGAERHPSRHGENHDRDQIGNDQRDNRGDVSFDFVGRDQHQQRDDRKRRGNGRQHSIMQWVIDLIPHPNLPDFLIGEAPGLILTEGWSAASGACSHQSPRRTQRLMGVVDTIPNKTAAFPEMQFLLSGLTPAILNFRIVIVDGLFNLRRRFRFSRR